MPTFPRLPLASATVSLGLALTILGPAADAFSPMQRAVPPPARPLAELVDYSPRRVVEILKSRGYGGIVMTDRTLPGYQAEACLGAEKFLLRINRWGDIVNRQSLGRCGGSVAAPPPPPPGEGSLEIRSVLESRGFSEIRFLDAEPPAVIAQACRGRDKLRLVMNRFGDIRDRQVIGRCSDEDSFDTGGSAQPSEGQLSTQRQRIKSILNAQGYDDIEFSGRHLFRFDVTACRGGNRYQLVVGIRGAVRRSTIKGPCEQPADDVVATPPPKRYERAEIRRRERIRPEVCQEYFDWLLYERTVLFDVASARIRSDSAELLADLAIVANRCPDTSLEISGHTDSDGTDESNQRLSEERATAVAGFLAKNGIGRDRLFPIGFGEERPVAPNSSSANKQQNRRIEFSVRWE